MVNIIKYGLAFALSKLTLLLLLPFYVRYMSVDQYGQFELINSIVSLLIPIGLIGLDQITLRYYLEVNSRTYRNIILSFVNKYFIFSVILYFIIVWLINFFIPNTFYGSFVFVVIIFTRLVFEGAAKLYRNLLRINNKVNKLLIIETFSFLLTVISTICLVYFLDNPLLGALLGITIQPLIPAMLFLFNMKKKSSKKVKLKVFGLSESDLLKYGIPLILISSLQWIINLSDRIIIEAMLGTYFLGVYSGIYRLVASLQLFVQAFGMYWPRFFYSKYKEQGSEEYFSKIFNVLLLCVLMLGLIIDDILIIIGKILLKDDFLEYLDIVPFLSFHFLILLLLFISESGILVVKKSKYILYTSMIGAIINVLGNMIFVPIYGIKAAAFFTMFSTLLILVFRHVIGGRYYKIKLNAINKIFLIVFIFINVIPFVHYLDLMLFTILVLYFIQVKPLRDIKWD